MQRRVAVTGLGVISASGLTLQDFWSSIREGRSAIKPITRFEGLLRFPNAAEITDFDENRHFDGKEAQFLDPFAQYGVVAARDAIRDAGIEWTQELKEQTAIITGSCLGGVVSGGEAARSRRLPRLLPGK